MKKSVNLNYLWSKFSVDQLALYGLKNVCISPGSRSTPLATAFAENKKNKKYVIVDERSSAFFALGLAKQTGQPVAIVTSSGTATANLYPAIIEAYLQRIPLIVCTADRPAYLRNTGTNQTINQNNLYKNHIRYFKDLSLPALSLRSFNSLQKVVAQTYITATTKNRGPVHLNFQFEKPLEKSIRNLQVEEQFLEKLKDLLSPSLLFTNSQYSPSQKQNTKSLNQVIKKIKTTNRGIILVGWDNYNKSFIRELLKLSNKIGFPILADGASGIYLKSEHKNIIVNHQAFLRSKKFTEQYSPEFIIQFGNAPTSNAMLDFVSNSKAYRIGVNAFGDRKDSGKKFNKIIVAKSEEFCRFVSENVDKQKDKNYLNVFHDADEVTENFKKKFFSKIKVNDELGIINKIIESLPNKSNLFVSNSLPIRDLEFFKSKSKKKTNLFVNRGASGIDGVSSTTAGIAASSKSPTVLVTGDLSFFHDTNGLHTIAKYKIPLIIILINNGGGAIFNMLPISKEKKIFDDYFFTPLNVNFKDLIKTYGGNYKFVNSFSSLKTKLQYCLEQKEFSLLEIKTDYKKGSELRKKYFREVIKQIEKIL